MEDRALSLTPFFKYRAAVRFSDVAFFLAFCRLLHLSFLAKVADLAQISHFLG